jgi:hypothetical protein
MVDEAWILSQRCAIEAILATIEGMKAENDSRMMLGQTPRYGENDFNTYANQLQTLAEYIMRSR